MQTINYRERLLNIISLMLLFPAFFFLVICVLKYMLEINGPYDAAEPTLAWLGLDQGFGFNINLVILLGPVAAILFAAWQTVRIHWQNSKLRFGIQLTFIKRKMPLLIMFISMLVLGTLSVYL